MENTSKPYVDRKSEIVTVVKPNIAGKKSIKVFLKTNQTYMYCTCGMSQKQPFCDGSHFQKPGYKPLKFVYSQPDTEKSLCLCKHNKDESGPFCDGSHKLWQW